jgi:hypothetical protein
MWLWWQSGPRYDTLDCSRVSQRRLCKALFVVLSDAFSRASNSFPLPIPSANPRARPNSVPSAFLSDLPAANMRSLLALVFPSCWTICKVSSVFCFLLADGPDSWKWSASTVEIVQYKLCFHCRLGQLQVYLPACSCLTPAPNKWQQGDSGYKPNTRLVLQWTCTEISVET